MTPILPAMAQKASADLGGQTADRLDFHKVAQAKDTRFAAIARLFVTAKRRPR